MRKQVYNLSVSDLQTHPIWEFTLGEEGIDEQDEATVRPMRDGYALTGTCPDIIRTEFISRDGNVYYGYYTPAKTNDIGSLHPVIVTHQGQVRFYYGIRKPDSDVLAANYHMLETTKEKLFPLHSHCSVFIGDYITDFDIPAFAYITTRPHEVLYIS